MSRTADPGEEAVEDYLETCEKLADEAGLKDNSPVELLLRDKKVVIVPVVKPALSLEVLLTQVTDENHHREVDTGPVVGGEVW